MVAILRLEVLLLAVVLKMSDATLERCNIVCGNEDELSSLLTPNGGQQQQMRGKAGPKGDKGDPGQSCTCPTLDSALITIRNEIKSFRPRDCFDIKFADEGARTGLYRIYPPMIAYHPAGLQVLCDMETDGGGWVVFQHRFDGSVDFLQGWTEYVNGFGQLSEGGEFWLGLETVHQMTNVGKYDLRIDLSDFENQTSYAAYSSFSLSAGTDYSLSFNEYSGTAGSGLFKNKFSTTDRDQDTHKTNCAVAYHGAWWYTKCHAANLNGLYLRGETERYAVGMVWKPWKGYHYSLKTSQMKFRPSYNY